MQNLKITAMDHIVLNISDIDRSLQFYMDVLGLKAERLDEYRKGEAPFPSVRISDDTLIDLFPSKDMPLGESAPKNLNHYCMVAEALDLNELVDNLREQGVTVLQEPVSRWGAHGRAMSVYILDPDGNQVEIRSY